MEDLGSDGAAFVLDCSGGYTDLHMCKMMWRHPYTLHRCALLSLCKM